MSVQGIVKPGFEGVREAFSKQFDDGLQIGASVAVYLRGELVVNLWGGQTAPEGGEPWREETMTICYSTTKGLTATALHVLADRGLVEYEAPVSKYWPEFAQNGKDSITVYHLLTHQAGIPQIPDGVTIDNVTNWDAVVRELAMLAPVWEPGTDSGYHALNFGWLVGEVVRRVDGRSLGTFLREEVTQPLGITKMYVGAPESEEPNIAQLYSAPETPEAAAMRKAFMESDSLTVRAMGGKMSSEDGPNLQDVLNSREGHAAEIPAVSGIMCARDLARFYACLANYGELDGVRIMSEATVRKMSELQTQRPDKVIMLPIGWSLGYMNGGMVGWPQGMRKTSFGHPGLGGSVGFADPEIGMSFGFVPNLLMNDLIGAGRGAALAEAARGAID
jgi:CubicO group peptidase (beta-lactamase class C family)